MWLLWLGLILLALKLTGIWGAADWSWWWIALPFLLAFVWFELQERLGWSKKREHDEVEKARRARIRHGLDPKANARTRK